MSASQWVMELLGLDPTAKERHEEARRNLREARLRLDGLSKALSEVRDSANERKESLEQTMREFNEARESEQPDGGEQRAGGA